MSKFYHYTNIDGLMAILKQNKVRLSAFVCLNDADEFQYGQSLVEKYCGSSSLFDEDKTKMFCLSGTRLQDDAAMWERYGDGGFGFCVELRQNSNGLIDANMNSYSDNDETIIGLATDVLYGEQEVATYLGNLKEPLSKLQKILLAMSIKRSGWQNENEVRKYLSLGFGDKDNIEKWFSRNALKDYIYLSYDSENMTSNRWQIVDKHDKNDYPPIIESVTFGPNITKEYKEQLREKIKEFEKEGYEINVYDSELHFK
jgi:hypothetical protein